MVISSTNTVLIIRSYFDMFLCLNLCLSLCENWYTWTRIYFYQTRHFYIIMTIMWQGYNIQITYYYLSRQMTTGIHHDQIAIIQYLVIDITQYYTNLYHVSYARFILQCMVLDMYNLYYIVTLSTINTINII